MHFRSAPGREGRSVYVLNGSKMFISNAPIADTALIYAATGPVGGVRRAERLHRGKGVPGIIGVKASPSWGSARHPRERSSGGLHQPRRKLLGGAQGNGLSIMFWAWT